MVKGGYLIVLTHLAGAPVIVVGGGLVGERKVRCARIGARQVVMVSYLLFTGIVRQKTMPPCERVLPNLSYRSFTPASRSRQRRTSKPLRGNKQRGHRRRMQHAR